ncbi:MAG: hypothetical protein HQ518_22360 [Rhodopirellula sp.]|nr:hypothetical protein [Rhodopirellula sp.]
MKRLFGGIAMIDVMSICVLTLLVASLTSGESRETPEDSVRKLASDMMVIRARVDLAGKTPVEPPKLGLEVVLNGVIIDSEDIKRGVLSIESDTSGVTLFMVPPHNISAEKYIHLFIRDRGSADLKDVRVVVEAQNFPGLDLSAKIDSPVATALSWKILLSAPEDTSHLLISSNGD